MAGITWRITARNIEQAKAELTDVVRRVEDLRPVLAQFGVHMLRSIQENFAVGGRPRFRPWAVSTAANEAGPLYLAGGRRTTASRGRTARARTGKVLYDTGTLANSIKVLVAGNRTLSLGTNLKYAAIHQLGGTINIPGIRPVRAHALRWFLPGGKAVFAKKAAPHTVRIPARPYLVAQPEDLEILQAMIDRHVKGAK